MRALARCLPGLLVLLAIAALVALTAREPRGEGFRREGDLVQTGPVTTTTEETETPCDD